MISRGRWHGQDNRTGDLGIGHVLWTLASVIIVRQGRCCEYPTGRYPTRRMVDNTAA